MAVTQAELSEACDALADSIANGDEEKKQKVLAALDVMIDHLETYAEVNGGTGD